MPRQPLLSKRQSEIITVEFEFREQLAFGETLSSPSVTVEVFTGFDYDTPDLLSGSASVSGTVVSQKIKEGMAGAIYSLTCSVTGSSGNVYRTTRRAAVLSDVGGFAAGALPSLTGVLPDGVVGAPYSAPLAIAGGYPPYSPVAIISGDPSWMGFSVSGNQLICAGTPDEAAATSYNFTAEIFDQALNHATAPQSINITRIIASGNVPNAGIGAYIAYSYTADFGTPPYTFSLNGGALPAGWSMDSTGLVTGIATTAGTSNWKPLATDANGITDELDDSNTIDPSPWLYVAACSAGATARPPIVSKQGGDSGTYSFIPVLPSPLDFSSEFGFQYVHGVMFYISPFTGFFLNRQWAEGGSTWETLVNFNPNNSSGRQNEIIWIPNLGRWMTTIRNATSLSFLYSNDGKTWFDGPAIHPSIPTGPNGLITKKKGTTTVIGTNGNVLWISTDNSLTWASYTEPLLHPSLPIDCILGVASGFLLFGVDPSGNLIVLKSTTGQSGSWSVVSGTPPTTQKVRLGCVLDYANDIVAVVYVNAVSSIITGFGSTFGFTGTSAGTNGSTNSAPISATSRQCMCGRVVSPGVYELFTYATISPGVQHIYRYRSATGLWSSLGAYAPNENPTSILLLRDKDMQE